MKLSFSILQNRNYRLRSDRSRQQLGEWENNSYCPRNQIRFTLTFRPTFFFFFPFFQTHFEEVSKASCPRPLWRVFKALFLKSKKKAPLELKRWRDPCEMLAPSRRGRKHGGLRALQRDFCPLGRGRAAPPLTQRLQSTMRRENHERPCIINTSLGVNAERSGTQEDVCGGTERVGSGLSHAGPRRTVQKRPRQVRSLLKQPFPPGALCASPHLDPSCLRSQAVAHIL